MTTTQGTRYLLARATKDGRVATVLLAIERYDRIGDVVLRDQSFRQLNDLAFEYDADLRPMYRAKDVFAAADVVAERENAKPASVRDRRSSGGRKR